MYSTHINPPAVKVCSIFPILRASGGGTAAWRVSHLLKRSTLTESQGPFEFQHLSSTSLGDSTGCRGLREGVSKRPSLGFQVEPGVATWPVSTIRLPLVCFGPGLSSRRR